MTKAKRTSKAPTMGDMNYDQRGPACWKCRTCGKEYAGPVSQPCCPAAAPTVGDVQEARATAARLVLLADELDLDPHELIEEVIQQAVDGASRMNAVPD